MTKFVLKKFPEILKDIPGVETPMEANRLISKYDGMLELAENPEVLTNILFLQEAVLSSRLEGTVATISDILEYKIGKELSEQKRVDAQEIKNYQDALRYFIEEAEEHKYKISNRVIKNIQHMLLDNDRGKDKLKGAFKTKQNYIGNKFDQTITYTPVSPVLTEDYMENLMSFINDKTDDFCPIVKVGIIHAYFELIHPFEDGNGRVGRILIPILLKKYNVLDTPYFYISYYLSKNRERYISALEEISKNCNWSDWINLFIESVEEQSKMLMGMLKELNNIKKDTKEKVAELKTQFSIQIIDFLFKRIKFNTKYFIEKTGINANTSRVLLRQLGEKGIISVEERGVGKRSTIYKFDAMMDVVKDLGE
jgi:Fic family protein